MLVIGLFQGDAILGILYRRSRLREKYFPDFLHRIYPLDLGGEQGKLSYLQVMVSLVQVFNIWLLLRGFGQEKG